MVPVILTASVTPENTAQIERMTKFFADNSTDVFTYAGVAFLIGLGVILLLVLITFAIFKALSFFGEVGNF